MDKKHKEGKQAELHRKFIQAREDAACAIFESGSYEIDLKNGHEIAIHQKFPDAPRPRIYFHIRPEGYREGKLTRRDMSAVGRALVLKAKQAGLLKKERAIVGIPNAGTHLVDAMLYQLSEKERQELTCVPLEKIDIDGKRAFQIGQCQSLSSDAYTRTLLVDDLVQSWLSKLLISDTIEKGGGRVTDILVFNDQSFNATELFWERGIRLHSVWKFGELLDWALANEFLTRRACDTIFEHQLVLHKFLRSIA